MKLVKFCKAAPRIFYPSLILLSTLTLSTPASSQQLSVQDIRLLCSGLGSSIGSSDDVDISVGDQGLRAQAIDGELSVYQGDELILRLDDFSYDDYIGCVEKLLVLRDRDEPKNSTVGYPEPTRDEMLTAHRGQVASFALQIFPIEHFEKAECIPSLRAGYDCSYTIRAGSGGSPKFVTNTFVKAGENWVMLVDR